MELPGLTTDALGREITLLEEVDSTNNYAKDHADELGHLSLVIARRQMAGKGLRGRVWNFEPGKSLAMSLLIKRVRMRDLRRLPVLFALGIHGGLEALCGPGFGIKWSNDILYGGKKVCGILVESKISAQNVTAVGGIGVNVAQTQKELDNHDLVYATSILLATGKLFSPEEVAGALCNEMERISLMLFREGFAPLRSLYRERCVTLGKQVRVIWEGREAVGTALDIDDDGCLLCEIGGEIVTVNTGEGLGAGDDGLRLNEQRSSRRGHKNDE